MSLVRKILEAAAIAVPLAEKFIKGSRRGEERKERVMEQVLGHLRELLEQLKKENGYGTSAGEKLRRLREPTTVKLIERIVDDVHALQKHLDELEEASE